ncbi:MAG TPA: biotin--[acetyl-CoA-carboxylase] ligase [Jatrophihabitans sp.]|jgi:BirA family biotin operon repressor/biotin-[acetyl-CoA-carboxylase] ligase|uniref:biotin--[acetyl-CoA-carboxylase] ligase n=1 Tax=Jatrophihabitans sp. TaxID=1932789 RepID=UPI002DFD02C3|nr:biotin--[acetyl-CoA-carboxylase] ligase [Jatrophihabitans sp.]
MTVDRPALDVERVRDAAARWARIELVEETASTNADLLADLEAPDRTARVAEYQAAGRGRFDRVWTSPPRAGLTFSALFRPAVSPMRWGWLPLLAGVALAEGVEEATGLAAALKWPNDLLTGPDQAKTAGILVQSSDDRVVVGIGLNVSTTPDELPGVTATSLALHSSTPPDRADLLIAILGRLDARMAQWADHDGDAEACGLAAAYRARCATVGPRVRVSLAEGNTLEGTAVDVDPAGRLVVAGPDGPQPVSAGDVEHVRAG